MRIEWNRQGFYDLRRDEALVGTEEAIANKIADAANAMANGGTFVVGSRQGRRNPQGRWHTSVATGDAKAMAEDRKHNILLRALGEA